MLALLVALPAMSQRNTLQLLRLSEDNDAFDLRAGLNDREYTNGTSIDLLYTKQTKPRFLSTLLIPIGNRSDADNPGTDQVHDLYNIGLKHFIFTPIDIFQRDVIRGSRPYTAVLYATHGLISFDPMRQKRLTTELGLGVLGRAALGKEIQTGYHKLLGYKQPKGWSNQLPTDVVLTYLIQYEKLLLRPAPYLEIIGVLNTNVGTLHTNVNAGILVRAGVFGDYFSSKGPKSDYFPNPRKFQLYAFTRPMGRFVVDDAVLQGGLFSRSGAKHTIDRDLVRRGFAHVEYGIVATRNRLGLSISQKLITKQYQGGPSHQVGNLTVFVGL